MPQQLFDILFERWGRGLRPIGRPRPNLHTLRHTFASWLCMEARDLRLVSSLLGHRNQSTTERYAHLSDVYQATRAQQAIDAIFENCCAPTDIATLSESKYGKSR
ncbi:MAG TPA: tyrosine-type recombinase/integrase [bacterium]|nr:tyrosine-type recombinase/integrase [bacterium]